MHFMQRFLHQELQAASVDPQQLEQQAACAERAVQHLVEQRDSLREQLPSAFGFCFVAIE